MNYSALGSLVLVCGSVGCADRVAPLAESTFASSQPGVLQLSTALALRLEAVAREIESETRLRQWPVLMLAQAVRRQVFSGGDTVRRLALLYRIPEQELEQFEPDAQQAMVLKLIKQLRMSLEKALLRNAPQHDVVTVADIVRYVDALSVGRGATVGKEVAWWTDFLEGLRQPDLQADTPEASGLGFVLNVALPQETLASPLVGTDLALWQETMARLQTWAALTLNAVPHWLPPADVDERKEWLDGHIADAAVAFWLLPSGAGAEVHRALQGWLAWPVALLDVAHAGAADRIL